MSGGRLIRVYRHPMRDWDRPKATHCSTLVPILGENPRGGHTPGLRGLSDSAEECMGPGVSQRDRPAAGVSLWDGWAGAPALVCIPPGVCHVYTLSCSFLTVSVICLENNLGLFII